MMDKNDLIKPGTFSVTVNADSRRAEFDIKNETIFVNEVPVDYIFIGDSITHMWELNAFFGGRGNIIINRGISGDTSEYVKKRFMADVIQLRPKYAIMQIGANDTWDMENYYWIDKEGKSPDIVFEKVIGNIKEIIKICEENSQELVICSLLPTDSIYTTCKKERNELIVKLNNSLSEICKGKRIYVDYHSGLVSDDGLTLKCGISDDGVHPRSLGYSIMAETLRETLNRNSIQI